MAQPPYRLWAVHDWPKGIQHFGTQYHLAARKDPGIPW